MKLTDLHTHTFLSDGILSPAELVYRCKLNGLKAVALTDHADYSNIKFVIDSALRSSCELSVRYDIDVVAGVELTYIPPPDIERMVALAREMGARIVVVHGETTAENVPHGTNLAAIRARCDILAHPGVLTSQQAAEASEKGVFIELTTRAGHRRGNAAVAEEALKNNCRMVINTDSHGPNDIMTKEKVERVLKDSSLSESDFEEIIKNSQNLLNKAGRK